jgi:hypothetical protein
MIYWNINSNYRKLKKYKFFIKMTGKMNIDYLEKKYLILKLK